jgi:hypothetical protein
LDSRKSITDKSPEEAAVAVAVAREATDPRVTAEAAEVAVVVIVPRVNVVSAPKVNVVSAPKVNVVNVPKVNAVVVTVAAVAEADHELPFPTVKTDPLLNVPNAVDSAEDSRARLARKTIPTIVTMALAVADV